MAKQLAAIDLGSNTFRLSIGRIEQDGTAPRLATEDRMRVLVAMAAGLGADQCVAQATIEQALITLARFGAQLRGFSPDAVRAVATNTFRVARNTPAFLPRAEAALGFPIDIISGEEEARLIYRGVAQTFPAPAQPRLVIDIGGGSTEFIIGCGPQTLALASLALGCTTWTRRFFPDGRITAERLDQAVRAAQQEIRPIAAHYRALGWVRAYGSSGTAKGLLAVLTGNGLSPQDITAPGMERLATALSRIGTVRLQDWAGLKAERAPVLAGGLAIMLGAFRELGIESMAAGYGALRLGVLCELFDRALSASRNGVDNAHRSIPDPAESGNRPSGNPDPTPVPRKSCNPASSNP